MDEIKKCYTEEVKGYFKIKAPEYDLVEQQLYWVLSDKLLWTILTDNVLSKINAPIRFIDAGAGTARWSIKILDQYEDSTGWLIDLSSDMIEQAMHKLDQKHYISRTKITIDNLDSMKMDNNEIYNLVFSFHNVLGFVNDPARVIKKLSQNLARDGFFVCVVPNFFHNIFFNIYTRNLELAEYCLKNHKGKFTENMPEMHMFTPKNLREMYTAAGLRINGIYGFPVAIYPGMQETQIRGQSKELQELLADRLTFDKIFNIESQLYQEQESATRGNNLIIIGQKN